MLLFVEWALLGRLYLFKRQPPAHNAIALSVGSPHRFHIHQYRRCGRAVLTVCGARLRRPRRPHVHWQLLHHVGFDVPLAHQRDHLGTERRGMAFWAPPQMALLDLGGSNAVHDRAAVRGRVIATGV